MCFYVNVPVNTVAAEAWQRLQQQKHYQPLLARCIASRIAKVAMMEIEQKMKDFEALLSRKGVHEKLDSSLH